jgi:large subunit ribosomal protein L18
MGALNKISRRIKIKQRIRKKISGTASEPRLTVFRSNKKIYAQIIDDINGVTLASAFSEEKNKGSKVDASREVGKKLAEEAKKNGIKSVVFDRNGYLYHGRVAALAEGAREGGLKF